MAWSNILGRKIDYPVVNLGFSGNGRLEEAVINYIAGFKASVYVLDCMPNFTGGQGLNPLEARKRLKSAVSTLRNKHPDTPILIVEHGGYSDGELQPERKKTYKDLNRAVNEVYSDLLSKGIKKIHLLKRKDIGLDVDSFVDGTHPNDYGMLQYARA